MSSKNFPRNHAVPGNFFKLLWGRGWLFLHYFTTLDIFFFTKNCTRAVSDYNCRILKTFTWYNKVEAINRCAERRISQYIIASYLFNVPKLSLSIEKKKIFKVAATDMRYFARSKFSRSSGHKKIFNMICQVVFKLRNLFCQER